jgi:DNA-binding transcriptional MerR regulator
MAVQVEFVTLGEASKILEIPAPTLRLWTDELEKYEVHYVKRNQRDERVYYENDLEIFGHMKKLKDEYKRQLRTYDVAMMIYQQATENDMFDLRRVEDAPKPEANNKHLELLNHRDVEQLLESDRVKQFTSIITKNIKDELSKQMDDEFMKVNRQIVEAHERLEQSIKERDKQFQERMDERDKLTNEYIAELREKRKPKWWQIWK